MQLAPASAPGAAPLPPGLRACARCIFDESTGGVEVDAEGLCNLCRQTDLLVRQFGTGTPEGERRLQAIVDEIKAAGRGKRYDCVVGVSGGTDSSYMLHLARQWGLRPLAVHYDNTWNSAVATQNIHRMLTALDIDLETHVVDNKEADDIFRSFFLAGVAEIEASTDLGLAETLYRAAARHRIGYVLEGHSFLTEGITPLGRNYFDGRYIQAIHRRYGRRRMRTYPLMTFSRFLWWSTVRKVKKIRPLWYLDYSKEAARALLESRYGWAYYGGHHLENRMSAFLHSVYLPGKFGTDLRNVSLAAHVRQGSLTREQALAIYARPPEADPQLVELFKKRLGFGDAEYDRILRAPPRSWQEFPTYKRRFELLRPLFAALARANLVPTSFYLKYCFPFKDAPGRQPSPGGTSPPSPAAPPGSPRKG